MKLKNQPIAAEGVLSYKDKKYLKRWDDLKRFIGTEVPVVVEHPPSYLVDSTTKVIGKAKLKECPMGAKWLCADVVVDDDKVPLGKRGWSIGYLTEIEEKEGEYKGIKYDGVQKIVKIDHLALTSHPRNPFTQIILNSNDSNNKYICIESIMTEELKMDEAKKVEVKVDFDSITEELKKYRVENDSLRKELDSLKAEIDSLRKENEKLREENKKLIKAQIDSLLGEFGIDTSWIEDIATAKRMREALEVVLTKAAKTSFKPEGDSDEAVTISDSFKVWDHKEGRWV